MENVDQLYDPIRTSWPEATELAFGPEGLRLRLFFANPSDSEVRAVADGVAEFGLFIAPPALIFLYRFDGAIRWSDLPFSVHLLPDLAQLIPQLEDGAREQLTVLLVAADTGVLRATRHIRLGPVFSHVVREALRAQLAEAWDAAAYLAAVQELYWRFPDSADMAGQAVMRWSTGRRSRVGSAATRRHGGSELRRGGHAPGSA